MRRTPWGQLRHFFCLWYKQLMKMVWHKHNLIISSSVGSGHLNKYSYEIPHLTYQGEGTCREKEFQSNIMTSLIWDSFSKWRFPLSHIMPLFKNSIISREATSSYFFRVTIFTQQLLFRSSYFFRAAAFYEELLSRNSRVFTAVTFFSIAIFSERKFYRAASS